MQTHTDTRSPLTRESTARIIRSDAPAKPHVFLKLQCRGQQTGLQSIAMNTNTRFLSLIFSRSRACCARSCSRTRTRIRMDNT